MCFLSVRSRTTFRMTWSCVFQVNIVQHRSKVFEVFDNGMLITIRWPLCEKDLHLLHHQLWCIPVCIDLSRWLPCSHFPMHWALGKLYQMVWLQLHVLLWCCRCEVVKSFILVGTVCVQWNPCVAIGSSQKPTASSLFVNTCLQIVPSSFFYYWENQNLPDRMLLFQDRVVDGQISPLPPFASFSVTIRLQWTSGTSELYFANEGRQCTRMLNWYGYTPSQWWRQAVHSKYWTDIGTRPANGEVRQCTPNVRQESS